MKNRDFKAGVLAVGTFVVDYHKVVDHYPRQGKSACVRHEQVSNGGAPLNTLINLAKLEVDFPLHAAAKVGKDLDGKLILEYCQKHNIDTSQLVAVDGGSTGYTDVFTVASTGRHTCFHYSGIGDTFSRTDVKLRAINPKILFLGSLGALGKLDKYNPLYGRNGATQLVRDAHKQGITTVIEIAPTNGTLSIDDYIETISQADYLILNDALAEDMLGIELYTDGYFDPEPARDAAKKIIRLGLRKAVVIYARSTAIFIGTDGQIIEQTGCRLPANQRVGSAGMDHAFTAGFLEGLYHQKPIELCLKQGLAVAVACRRDLSPSDSIPPLNQCMELHDHISHAIPETALS